MPASLYMRTLWKKITYCLEALSLNMVVTTDSGDCPCFQGDGRASELLWLVQLLSVLSSQTPLQEQCGHLAARVRATVLNFLTGLGAISGGPG